MKNRHASMEGPSTTPEDNLYPSHPIKRVPVEIVIEIFQQVCPPPDPEAWEMSKHTPLFLGTICREWREIAWSAPSLWKDVALVTYVTPTQLNLLREWLLRAKSAPLNITLYTRGRGDNGDPQLLHVPLKYLKWDKTILMSLLTRSCFWSTFRCDAFLPQLLVLFQNVQFPILKVLHLTTYPGGHRYNNPGKPLPSAMFTASPLLEHLSLRGFSFPETVTHPPVLKSLAFGLPSCEDCINILRMYPSLVSVRFMDIQIEGSSTFSLRPTSTLTHSTLSTLSVACLNLEDMGYFLDHIQLPALHNLKVVSLSATCLSSVTSLVRRSECLLDTLELKILLNDNDDLVAAFSVMPRLTHLRWMYSFSFGGKNRSKLLGADVINMLSPTYFDGKPLLANLTSLTWLDHIPDESDMLLAEIVEQRWRVQDDRQGRPPAVAQLKSVTFCYRFCGLNLRKTLSKLSLEGMKVQFDYPSVAKVNKLKSAARQYCSLLRVCKDNRIGIRFCLLEYSPGA